MSDNDHGGPILPVVVPPIFEPPTVEELIEIKRKAGVTRIIQIPPSLAVEFAPLQAIEVDMWRDAIGRSDKSKYITVTELAGLLVVAWNADHFPKT